MIHKRVVFGVDNQRRTGDAGETRHRAALAIVIDGIAKTVNFRRNQIIEIADAAQALKLGELNRQRAGPGLQLAGGVGFQQVQQIELIKA